MNVGQCNKTDVYILIDGSESISEPQFELLRSFLGDLTIALLAEPIDLAIAYAEFSDLFNQVSSNFTSDQAELLLQLSNPDLQSFGTTFTATALNTAADFIDGNKRPGADPVLILVTDGRISGPDVVNLPGAVARLDALRIGRVALGIGNNLDLTELATITDNVQEFLFTTEDFNEFARVVQPIVGNATMACVAPCPTTTMSTTPSTTMSTTETPTTTEPLGRLCPGRLWRSRSGI